MIGGNEIERSKGATYHSSFVFLKPLLGLVQLQALQITRKERQRKERRQNHALVECFPQLPREQTIPRHEKKKSTTVLTRHRWHRLGEYPAHQNTNSFKHTEEDTTSDGS